MPTQMRMLRAGIAIYVDVKGKEGKSMGVNFPFMGRSEMLLLSLWIKISNQICEKEILMMRILKSWP